MNPMARKHAILTESVGNELIVYDEEAKKAHRLNPTAAFLWRHCDGTRTTADLAKLAHQEMGVPEDEELVFLALEPLTKQRLIKTSSSVEGVSRRDALKRLRAVGVTATMIPIITTLAAPSPAAAASPKSTADRERTSGPSNFFEDTWKRGRRGGENGSDGGKGGDGGRDGGGDGDDATGYRRPGAEPYRMRPWR
jgi:Coenzyme PQQ synthesis protein D (PqqD)